MRVFSGFGVLWIGTASRLRSGSDPSGGIFLRDYPDGETQRADEKPGGTPSLGREAVRLMAVTTDGLTLR